MMIFRSLEIKNKLLSFFLSFFLPFFLYLSYLSIYFLCPSMPTGDWKHSINHEWWRESEHTKVCKYALRPFLLNLLILRVQIRNSTRLFFFRSPEPGHSYFGPLATCLNSTLVDTLSSWPCFKHHRDCQLLSGQLAVATWRWWYWVFHYCISVFPKF